MDGGFGLDSGNTAMDSDWLDNFFDDPVLNDRMISDALQPAPGQQSTGGVQSEHSYSLHGNQDDENETTLDLSKTNTSGTQQQQNTSTTDMKGGSGVRFHAIYDLRSIIAWTLTLTVLVTRIDARWEGMGDVASARYEPALLPPCPTIRGFKLR